VGKYISGFTRANAAIVDAFRARFPGPDDGEEEGVEEGVALGGCGPLEVSDDDDDDDDEEDSLP
jgi:hypothetical protein